MQSGRISKDVLTILQNYLTQDQRQLLAPLLAEQTRSLIRVQKLLASICDEQTYKKVISALQPVLRQEDYQPAIRSYQLKEEQEEVNEWFQIVGNFDKSQFAHLNKETNKSEQVNGQSNTGNNVSNKKPSLTQQESMLKSGQLILKSSRQKEVLKSKEKIEFFRQMIMKLVENSLNSSTRIYPIVPYKPLDLRKPFYSRQIDEAKKDQNPFFIHSQKNQLDHKRWELILAIISSNEIKNITFHSRQKNVKRQPKIINFQGRYIHLFFQNVFTDTISEYQIYFTQTFYMKDNQVYRFKVKQLMEKFRGKAIAVYSTLEQEQNDPIYYNFTILSAINFIIRNQIAGKNPNLMDMFKWLKLFFDIYDRNVNLTQEKALFSNKTIFMGHEVSQWYFFFFYGIFAKTEAYKSIDKYNFIKSMSLKNIQFRKWQKSQHFDNMQLLYYEYLLYSQLGSNNIQYVDALLRTNLSYQDNKVTKRMLMKISILNPRIMARSRQIVDKVLVQSLQITAYDYLLLKSRYLSLYSEQVEASMNQANALYYTRQNELNNYLIVTFLAQLIQKCEQLPQKQEGEINFNKDGLKNIFIRVTTWKDQFRISELKFCDMYMQLKRLLKANIRFGQIVIGCILSKLESHFPILLQKLSSNLCLLMLLNPVLGVEEEALEKYFQDHSFTNNEVNQLIDYYFQNTHYIGENRFLQKIGKITERRVNPKFQIYSLFKKANLIANQANHPHKPIFNKIFLALLEPLQIPINQIIMSKHLKEALLVNDEELRLSYSKKICSEIKRQVRYDEHFCNILNRTFVNKQRERRGYFIGIYFENEKSAIEQVQQKLWDCLTKNIDYLHSISTRFRLTFDISVKRLLGKVQSNKITSIEVDSLHFNLKNMKYYVSQDFTNAIEKSNTRKVQFYQKLKMIQYLFGRCDNMAEIGSYFTGKEVDMNSKTLQQIYTPQIGEQEKWLFDFCHQLRALMSYQSSSIANSLTIQQIKGTFEIQKKQLLEIFQKYYASKLNYKQLQRYFPANIAIQACNIFCEKKSARTEIIRCSNKMHMKNITRLEQFVHSYINIIECLKADTDTSNLRLFLQIIENIKIDAQNVMVIDTMLLIQQLQLELSRAYHIKIVHENPLSLLYQLQGNEISQVIRSTALAMPLFNMIQSRNIDHRSIGDLKEYINDQENSSLRIDSIKEFQHVLDYWLALKKSLGVNQFIAALERLIQTSKGDIWQYIDNCYAIYRLIDQKLDQAANRQTSFKYQIEAIFQNSTLMIGMKKDLIELQVLTNPLLANGSSAINKPLVIDYRKLQNFKDKSILLISDIERQQNQDANIQKTLQSFKRFEEYFSTVQRINHIVQQLVNYGYNPIFIVSEVKVSNNDFSQLQVKEVELEQMCSEWVKGIKQLYKQSYLLTHFTGSQLSIFISRCLNNTYHNSLYSILKLTKRQFQERTKSEEFKLKIEKAVSSKPIQQIALIVEAYQEFQKGYRKISKVVQKHQIQLFCVAEKYLYCCLLEQSNNIAQPNRVFYCLESTKNQQIQVFLWRGLIDSMRTYYFIGAHNLKQEMKLYFWNQLLYLFQEHKQSFLRSKISFIDNIITDKFYSFVIRSKLFDIAKRQFLEADLQQRAKKMIGILPSTWIVESTKAGLGKTYRIEQLSKLQQKTVRYFPIAGNVDFGKLARRLKELHITQEDCLSVSLFEVQDWKKIEVFLSELILFRSFYYEEFIFLPEGLWIFIEIQNIYQQKNEEMYPLLKLLTRYNQGIYINQFDSHLISFDQIKDQQKFVLLYMDILDKPGLISTKELYFVEVSIYEIPPNAHQLIQKYFCSWFKEKGQKPTFTCYKCFMKMLYRSFKAFSQCEYLKIQHINVADAQFQYLQFSKFRQSFLEICIQNVLQFMQESHTSNDFSCTQNIETFHNKMNNINMLILPSNKSGNYQFVYTSDQKVPLCIKSLLLTQNPIFFRQVASLKNKEDIHQLFSKTSLNNLDDYSLQQKLQNTLMSIADQVVQQDLPEQIKRLYYPNFHEYKLTLDNFIKICLIWHRASSGIPCILMGESGVGKTKLISFFVQQVLKNVLEVINLHAGIHEDELIEKISRVKKTAEGWGDFNRVWLFFDEFNTCDELGYIKEMTVDRRFMGVPLPANLIIVAACNPYRKKRRGRLLKAGIQRPISNQNELAFTVKAPPLSMIQLMWDYQQLKRLELSIYIQKMLENIKYKKRQELIEVIIETHEFLNNNIEISSASLRDVARFKKIYEWFYQFMPKNAEKGQNKKQLNNYTMDRSQRCVILTYSFCYCLRLATSQERQQLYDIIEKSLNFHVGWVKRVVMNQQVDYVRRLKVSDEQIALNTALVQNVFTCLVCLLNKIPVLLIGNPGSSKSLSMRLIQSNMRGKGSQSQFCRQFPELNVLYFQGSESSTSKGVQQIFEKALRWKSEANKKWQIEQCILFDEIGLAEKSVHNPLKVLHSKLQTSSDQICFIGISNWQLDLAKMSRFLVLARSSPDAKDLSETAYQIAQSYLETYKEAQYVDYQISRKNWESLGQHYFQFIAEWEKDQKNKNNFFGLRDFYGYVKYICSQLIKEKGQIGAFQKAVELSIQINFDGQQGSVELFKSISNSLPENRTNPLKLIQSSLQRGQSRCLLLIIKGDSLVPLVNKGIDLGDPDRKIICIHGSTFSIDQESEQYNQEMTALTINHISRGNVLAFKDINNSIQTSLYDLFNKSFTRVGVKRYCRIAVGANSNPKCLVHHNFNAIVYIDQGKLESLDPPFLNRFQKHYLNIKNMITRQQLLLLDEIRKWVEELLAFRGKDSILKNQQFLINSSQEAIITLIIKHRGSENQAEDIKRDLLSNKTTDLLIGLDGTEHGNIQNGSLVPNFLQGRDYIVFTYDELINITENSIFIQGAVIHIQEIESQKQLRKQLKNGLLSEKRNLQVYLNLQNHRKHLSFILILIDEIKTTLQIAKQVFVIIQMHRFSLHHLKITQLNLSYLHPFQQIFIETLNTHKQERLARILRNKNCLEAYELLEMRGEFQSHFNQTIKCCKFVSARQKREDLGKTYFQECLLLKNHSYFVQTFQNSLSAMFKSLPLSLKLLQQNSENIITCSNILEALEKHIQLKVRQVLYGQLKAIIERGLLFHFNDSTLRYISLSDNSQKGYKLHRHFIHGLAQKEFQQSLQSMIEQGEQENVGFKLGVEQNVLLICEETYLLPISVLESNFIFGDGPGSISRLTKKISLEYSSKEDLMDINNQIKELILQRSKASKLYRISQLREQQIIQKYLIIDLLSNFLGSRGRRRYQVQKLGAYLQIFFGECTFEQKILLISFDQTVTLCLLDLFESISHKNNIAGMILDPVGFKMREAEIEISIITFIQKIVEQTLKVLIPSRELIEQFGSIIFYQKYFSNIYRNIQGFYVSFKTFAEGYIERSQIILEILIFLTQVQSSMVNQIITQFEGKMEGKAVSITEAMFEVLQEKLHTLKQNKLKQNIICFLCSHIFSQMIKQKKSAQKQKWHLALTRYFNMVNDYVSIANKSAPIFEIIFGYNNQCNSISTLMSSIRDKAIDQLQAKLDLRNNLSVAVGLYFSRVIQGIQMRECSNDVDNAAVSTVTVHSYFLAFQIAIDKFADEEALKLQKIVLIQFCKMYCLNYLTQLVQVPDREGGVLAEIDSILCQSDELVRHLRLFMAKNLLLRHGDLKAVRRNFLEMKRCNWIFHLKDLLEDEQTQCFLPILPSNHELQALITTFNQSRFTDLQSFHEIILHGLEDSDKTYLMLSYFLTTFFMQNCPQQSKNLLVSEVEGREDLKLPINLIVRQIILVYLGNKITDKIKSNPKNPNKSLHIILLNYLNVLISCRQSQSPLIQMFFDQDGRLPKDYSNWLGKRFLIGSIENPAAERVRYLQGKFVGDAGQANYLMCTDPTCRYITPIGGFFYGEEHSIGCGVLNPGASFNCNLCGRTLRILQDNTYQGKILDHLSLEEQKQQIEKFQTVRFFRDDKQQQILLKGHQLGCQIGQLKESLNMRRKLQRVITDYMGGESNFTGSKLLQSVVYFAWMFLAENQSIKQEQCQAIFEGARQKAVEGLLECSKELLRAGNDSIGFGSDDQMMVWHFTLAGKLFQLMNSKQKESSIVYYENKRSFQLQFGQILEGLCGIHKEKIILQNKKSLILSKSQILRQSGNVELHQQQFSMIKLFKAFSNDQSKSQMGRLKGYINLQILAKDFPFLSQVLNFRQRQRLTHINNIFLFLSRLPSLDLKLTKSESTFPIVNVVQSYLSTNEMERGQNLKQMRGCIDSWNQLARQGIKLRSGLTVVGELQRIDQKMPIRCFIPDRENSHNIEGKRVLQLIVTLANQYNDISNNLQNLAARNGHYFMSEFKMNPTSFRGQSFLEVSPDSLEKYLAIYSNYSVEYGLKGVQYDFSKIQSSLIREINGCKYFLTDPEEYEAVRLVGQGNYFMGFMREDWQLPFTSQMERRLKEYFLREEKNRGETFYKFVKEMISSLQNLIVCFKNSRRGGLKIRTIGQFISDGVIIRMKSFTKQLSEDPLQSLSMANLGALYQLLQSMAFRYNLELLNPGYSQPLQQYQHGRLEGSFIEMKRAGCRGLPSLGVFKMVLQRLVTRVLLVDNAGGDGKGITGYICQLDWLWPKGHLPGNFGKGLMEILEGIEISKVGSILQLVEDIQKKTGQKVQGQQVVEVQVIRREIKPLIKLAGGKKTKKKRNDFD